MRKLKLLCVLLAALISLSVFGCNKPNNNDSDSTSQSTSAPTSTSTPASEEDNNPSDEEYTPRAKQEMPTAEIVDANYDYGDPATWAGDTFTTVDLGDVYLQDVIDDTVYDWGHSVIKEDGVYKMWWVRPAVYDAIFYAESVDLKNWTNVQRVICESPNAINVNKYKNIKGMIGKPSVIHVGDTYYMYFEAPATEDPDITQTVLEWDNQVMLATSKNGIDWEYYADENGQPKPVVAMPAELMGNFNSKDYGAGQPSVFYKDGLFHLTYCYVIYSQNIAEMRLATSADGFNFGDMSTHTKIRNGNGMPFTYNTKTNKYMSASATTIYESATMDFTKATSTVYRTFDETTIQTGFCEIVKNASGLVDTETFYTIHLEGDKSTTDDWRAGHTTWDGHIHAVNPKEFANRMITLPNGAAATENNLKGYRNRANSYTKPTADAIYAADTDIKVDGEKDAAYEGASCIEIVRPVYNYGSNLTDTWAKAWLAWNEDYFYAYVMVYDNVIDNSYNIATPAAMYMRDSVDIFIDAVNDHTNTPGQSYGIEQYMLCIGSNNTDFMVKGANDYDITGDFSGIRRRIKRTDYGYCFEIRADWHELSVDFIEEGHTIGVDFQINDSMGNGVGREAFVVWSNHTGDSFRFVEGMGDVYLVK